MDRWSNLVQRLNLPAAADAVIDITRRYAEPHRAYHNMDHINACLSEFDGVRDEFDHPDVAELAIWLHDVVYDTHATDNELQSAEYANSIINECGNNQELAARVHDLIMATTHQSVPITNDAQLLVDIDLSILGTGRDDYIRFEQAIRSEYNWVPAETFICKRIEILQSFLDRSSIYATRHFRTRYEHAARENLTRTIADLEQ